jgi:transglutaminase-like putative cysteine protease
MNINRRKQIELLVPLICAWGVYAFAQKDLLLPLAALVIVGGSFLGLLVKGSTRGHPQVRVSAKNSIYISILLGALWRNLMPPPSDAVAFVPVLLSAVQAASICLAVVMWFSFHYRYRSHYLRLLPWLTVAASINIPFDPVTRLAFWVFCTVSVAMILWPVYVPYEDTLRQRIRKSKAKSRWTYAYPVLLAVISSAVFVVLVNGIRVGDELFMDMIMDYARFRKHFHFFDNKLLLAGSGSTRSDIRPIMEVEKSGPMSRYLIGQIFDDYNDGLWQAPYDLPQKELPVTAARYRRSVNLTLFEYLDAVIPAPAGVAAVDGKNAPYKIDSYGIVYNPAKSIPQVTVYTDQARRRAPLHTFDAEPYLKIRPWLKQRLQAALDRAVGAEADPYQAARRIEAFFTANYEYELYVNFKADDRGILYMIYRKQPAYCSYFATAMVLMLRAQGIPARMATGFWASETAAWNEDRYIVRGRDAHAWVQALLPARDPRTGGPVLNGAGEPLYQWTRFDPTPAASRLEALQRDKRINKIADWIWCTQKRARAAIVNMETRTLVMVLFGLMGFVVLQELVKKIIRRRRTRKTIEQHAARLPDPRGKALYQDVYRRFERFLWSRYRIERHPAETDAELLARLRAQGAIPPAVLARLETFLTDYHAARFGGKKAARDRLEGLLKEISKS